jgi:hypothetical protein
MAKKAPVKVDDVKIIVEQKRKKEVVTMAMVIAEVREVQAQKRKKLDDYNKAECPRLNLRQLYNFEFNNNVSNPVLKGAIRRVTGELAMHFIKSNYGILC